MLLIALEITLLQIPHSVIAVDRNRDEVKVESATSSLLGLPNFIMSEMP